MSINRIQKLLFSEYCDFEDMVLVESPFAQTTREGKGLRQVQLGLTPSKLVLATDILHPAEQAAVTYIPGLDPEIETFELVAVYPLECVNISVFHRKSRQSLKAHFCNNKVLYFELGGFEKRHMFWNLWCEKVRFLNPEEFGSSNSESSAATSNTNSTLYLVSSRQLISDTGTPQLWCKFGAGDYVVNNSARWTDRYLFLGSKDESPLNYTPSNHKPTVEDFVLANNQDSRLELERIKSFNRPLRKSSQVNRFGLGVAENCSSGLFLPAENYIVANKFSELTQHSTDVFTMYKTITDNPMSLNYPKFAETSVRLWEYYNFALPESKSKGKHRRRYAFLPQPYFLNGLGPWNLTPGARYSVQMKRAVSLVNIRRQPAEPELRLPVSKRQLVASVSYEDIRLDDKLFPSSNILKSANKSPVIFFWTPEYWYRPRSARDAYLELQTHLSKIRQYHQVNDAKKSKQKLLYI
ncbi:guanine nucleotide exchange factor [Holotrichia oblita]|uniref:Guanine nucleotide exchange factor n=1 Tax=Holotrichia oblita TaxID=644536 RepID=A0ACB9T7U2_HOLOL|nr:guanine nucleotide exchange factor [Holotrichia oblita]